jgi:hypothetical protein
LKNARQELNLHVNMLQSELEALAANIERALTSPPDAEDEHAMEWDVGSLPGEVVAALLEERRARGWDWRWEERKPFRTIIRFYRTAEAVPEHIPRTIS